jgi:hypothetical protein
MLTCPFNDDAQHCWNHALDQLVHHPGEVKFQMTCKKNVRYKYKEKKKLML